MGSVSGLDHPAEQAEAEIMLPRRGISVSARVELVHGDVVVVRPSVAEFVDQVVVQADDVVEVFWRHTDGQRTLPAEVIEVERGAVVRWRLRATGRAQNSQRRAAVRARVAVPVAARCEGVDLSGQTIDLSEAGLRATFEGYGAPPEARTRLALVVRLEEGAIATTAEVVRNQVNGAAWLISIRFLALEERDQDRIRRRVFQALREERARMAEDSPRR